MRTNPIPQPTDADLRRVLRRVWFHGCGCWVWTGSTRAGYARVRVAGRTVQVHRAMYSWFVQEPGDQMVVDHTCRNVRCVRPDHLEAVTHAENIRRGGGRQANYRDGLCAKGLHRMEGENVGLRKGGTRYCRECYRARHRAWETKHKERRRDALNAKQRERFAANREAILARQRERRKENDFNAWQRDYRRRKKSAAADVPRGTHVGGGELAAGSAGQGVAGDDPPPTS